MYAFACCRADNVFEWGEGLREVFGEGAGDRFEVGETNLSHVRRKGCGGGGGGGFYSFIAGGRRRGRGGGGGTITYRR